MTLDNPFLTEGYISPEYFCDRREETAMLLRHVTNRCNVALIAPRRLGKSGLIRNCFYQTEVKENFYTFYVDIYETKNMSEFVYELGKCILNTLKPQGRKAWEGFVSVLRSLQHTVTLNMNGMPEWRVSIGDIRQPDVTLDEIFEYLATANRPCIVAIDEFQVIADYHEKTVEASLRKRIQACNNARFIYSGSKRHSMSMMFASASRPFYNSSSIMGLEPIDCKMYCDFANNHLNKIAKSIDYEVFRWLYDYFDGTTWYIQYVLNMLYTIPAHGLSFTIEEVQTAILSIVRNNSFVYKALLFQLTTKQKQLLLAIAAEGKSKAITSQSFSQRCGMTPSTIQTAAATLLDRDFITQEEGIYQVYDLFFGLWLREYKR